MAKWNLGTNFTQIHPEIVQKFWEIVLWKQKQSTSKNLNPSLCFIHQLWRSGTPQMTAFFKECWCWIHRGSSHITFELVTWWEDVGNRGWGVNIDGSTMVNQSPALKERSSSSAGRLKMLEECGEMCAVMMNNSVCRKGWDGCMHILSIYIYVYST